MILISAIEAIIKKLDNSSLLLLKKELTVKPLINKQFQQDAQAFPYLESKRKLYIPRYFGINKFGKPLIDKINPVLLTNIKFSD